MMEIAAIIIKGERGAETKARWSNVSDEEMWKFVLGVHPRTLWQEITVC